MPTPCIGTPVMWFDTFGALNTHSSAVYTCCVTEMGSLETRVRELKGVKGQTDNQLTDALSEASITGLDQ